jgi:hypothetical protein
MCVSICLPIDFGLVKLSFTTMFLVKPLVRPLCLNHMHAICLGYEAKDSMPWPAWPHHGANTSPWFVWENPFSWILVCFYHIHNIGSTTFFQVRIWGTTNVLINTDCSLESVGKCSQISNILMSLQWSPIFLGKPFVYL